MMIDVEDIEIYKVKGDFDLEMGGKLQNISIAFHSYGELNKTRDNVIWVCHALTANSKVSDWWPGLFGEGKVLDPTKYFIVCANILGSIYGSTGPRSIDPKSEKPYGIHFPKVTIKDMARAHFLLCNKLNISSIELAIGGSCGGHQVQEMCLLNEVEIRNSVLLVTSAKETPWSIAIHEAQRLALKADQSFFENKEDSGHKGLKAARGMGLIGYRTFDQYSKTQNDPDDRYESFKASSYIDYQGEKLVKRFHAHSYYSLLNALDTHNIGRNRGGIKKALKQFLTKTLIISIDSDLLIPVTEQESMANYIPDVKHVTINSQFGHDGFLVEHEKINASVMAFLFGT